MKRTPASTTWSIPGTRSMLLVASLAASPASAQIVNYYHLDAIGNVRAITNDAQATVEGHRYIPFGEEWCAGPPGQICNGVAPGQPKRFTGKQRDYETGLDYFGARYYRANLGRFTTIDPANTPVENALDPQRGNRYAYARNNPLRLVDPDGRDWTDSTAGFLRGAGTTYVTLVTAPIVGPLVTAHAVYQAASDPVGTRNSAQLT